MGSQKPAVPLGERFGADREEADPTHATSRPAPLHEVSGTLPPQQLARAPPHALPPLGVASSPPGGGVPRSPTVWADHHWSRAGTLWPRMFVYVCTILSLQGLAATSLGVPLPAGVWYGPGPEQYQGHAGGAVECAKPLRPHAKVPH